MLISECFGEAVCLNTNVNAVCNRSAPKTDATIRAITFTSKNILYLEQMNIWCNATRGQKLSLFRAAKCKALEVVGRAFGSSPSRLPISDLTMCPADHWHRVWRARPESDLDPRVGSTALVRHPLVALTKTVVGRVHWPRWTNLATNQNYSYSIADNF